MSTKGVGTREAQTRYHLLGKDPNGQISHIECRLQTGRTHQIRVHMQHLGHPLIGDPTYGAQQTKQQSALNLSAVPEQAKTDILNFPRQALHAKAIRFIHPRNGEEYSYEKTPPDDLAALISLLD